jgi:hypothetical protein
MPPVKVKATPTPAELHAANGSAVAPKFSVVKERMSEQIASSHDLLLSCRVVAGAAKNSPSVLRADIEKTGLRRHRKRVAQGAWLDAKPCRYRGSTIFRKMKITGFFLQRL